MRAIMSSLIFVTPILKGIYLQKNTFFFFLQLFPCLAGSKIKLSARDQEIKTTELFLASLSKKRAITFLKFYYCFNKVLARGCHVLGLFKIPVP